MVNKTCIIVQARMNSKRLTGKVLMEIGGRPLIGILLERLNKTNVPVIMATSTNLENDVLVDYANSIGIKTFRGSEDNVLERFFFAAKKNEARTIIRVTGDNPLIDGALIKKSLEQFDCLDRRTYFSLGNSYPLGSSFEVFTMELLEEAYFCSTMPGEKEHVTPYMHQNVPGNIIVKYKNRNDDKSIYRLTVDTIADFNLIKILINEFNCHEKSLDEIIDVLDKNPQLASFNKHVNQKRWTD